MTKVCKRCGHEKQTEDFHLDSESKDGHKAVCADCKSKDFARYRLENREALNKAQRDRRSKNPKHIRGIFRKSHFKTKYGLTLDERDNLVRSQDNKCAVCESVFPKLEKPNRAQVPCVDHCHLTGKVRGMLCSGCNSGLGQFKDSIIRLQKAIEYLEKNS